MNTVSNMFPFVALLCALFAFLPGDAQFFGGFGWPWFGGYGGFGGYGYGGYGFSGFGCCGWGIPYYGGFFGKR